MINYWIKEEIALMVLLMEACNKEHQCITGFRNGRMHIHLPEYKRFKIVGSIINRSVAAVRRKYNQYIYRELESSTLITIDKEIAKQMGLNLDLSESIKQHRRAAYA